MSIHSAEYPIQSDAGWLINFDHLATKHPADGLIPVEGYDPDGRPPEEVAMMEHAGRYKAQAVFFEASRSGRAPVAQAFIFISDGSDDDPEFGKLHQRLWSWGGVPLIYRRTRSVVQLFRCAHKPDFISSTGEVVCRPFKTLALAVGISNDPWWDALRIRSGTLWDEPQTCKLMLSAKRAAHKRLIDAVKGVNEELNRDELLTPQLRRKLLILSLLIAYLEERDVLLPDYFGTFLHGATRFFEVLANGEALVDLLASLEERFNGNVFTLTDDDRQSLIGNKQLKRFAALIEGRQELNGQLTLWQLYSFKDLPVELISHIYQLFVKDVGSSIYTPPFLVRLMLDEALSWSRLDRLHEKHEIVLDPACGSGVFLVEAYKRLVLHWRSRNGWGKPGVVVLKRLLGKVHGIDLEEGAIELAAFSLCLALCDALEPETIRSSIKLFPQLAGNTLHHSCFFDAKDRQLVREPIGVLIGNPPFTSVLNTDGAKRSYERYEASYGSLPDKQLAYLFLHEGMEMVAAGGVLSMLQQYNFLYNQRSLGFRRRFIQQWDVREVLDFVSVRGLFQKGSADTKVIVVVAEASQPPAQRELLHATFRRSGRVDAEQGFDIDHYDLNLLPRELVLEKDSAWRTDLFGGGRAHGLVERLKTFRTLGQFAHKEKWDYGEGIIEGGRGVSRPADHVVGKPLLRSDALGPNGIDASAITTAPDKPYEGPRSQARFTPPMLLIREHMELDHDLWTGDYLTYTQRIVGFPSPKGDVAKLSAISEWLSINTMALRAYLALISPSLFTQKATALQADDIYSIPYPELGSLDLSENEQIIASDVVDYFCDLIRLGEDSLAMQQSGKEELDLFAEVFTKQINAIYAEQPLRVLEPYSWPGAICQPFCFGEGRVDWTASDELRGRLDALLKEQRGESLVVTRIARIYDERFVFLLKPDRKRYWLRSVALRDADDTLADLRLQGL